MDYHQDREHALGDAGGSRSEHDPGLYLDAQHQCPSPPPRETISLFSHEVPFGGSHYGVLSREDYVEAPGPGQYVEPLDGPYDRGYDPTQRAGPSGYTGASESIAPDRDEGQQMDVRNPSDRLEGLYPSSGGVGSATPSTEEVPPPPLALATSGAARDAMRVLHVGNFTKICARYSGGPQEPLPPTEEEPDNGAMQGIVSQLKDDLQGQDTSPYYSAAGTAAQRLGVLSNIDDETGLYTSNCNDPRINLFRPLATGIPMFPPPSSSFVSSSGHDAYAGRGIQFMPPMSPRSSALDIANRAAQDQRKAAKKKEKKKKSKQKRQEERRVAQGSSTPPPRSGKRARTQASPEGLGVGVGQALPAPAPPASVPAPPAPVPAPPAPVPAPPAPVSAPPAPVSAPPAPVPAPPASVSLANPVPSSPPSAPPELLPGATSPKGRAMDSDEESVTSLNQLPTHAQGNLNDVAKIFSEAFALNGTSPNTPSSFCTPQQLYDVETFLGSFTLETAESLGWCMSTYYTFKDGKRYRLPLSSTDKSLAESLGRLIIEGEDKLEAFVARLPSFAGGRAAFVRILKGLCLAYWFHGLSNTKDDVRGQSLQGFLYDPLRCRIFPALEAIAQTSMRVTESWWQDTQPGASDTFKPHVAFEVFDLVLDKTFVAPTVDDVTNTVRAVDVRRLKDLFRRTRSLLVHPTWGNLEGKTVYEKTCAGTDLLCNGGNLHLMQDAYALALPKSDPSEDHLPCIGNEATDAFLDAFSTAFKDAKERISYGPYATLLDNKGQAIASYRNFQSNILIAAVERRTFTYVTEQHGEKNMLLVESVLERAAAWSHTSGEDDPLVIIILSGAADTAELVLLRCLIGDNEIILENLEDHPELLNACSVFRLLFVFAYELCVMKFAKDPKYLVEYLACRKRYIEILKEIVHMRRRNYHGRLAGLGRSGSHLAQGMSQLDLGNEDSVPPAAKWQKAADLSAMPGFARTHRRTVSSDRVLPRTLLSNLRAPERIAGIGQVAPPEVLALVTGD